MLNSMGRQATLIGCPPPLLSAAPQATEAQALELLRRGVRCVAVDYREESIAAGVVAAAVLLPGPRRFLFRHTLGR